MSKTIQITNGPSREELFDGLRLFAEKRQVGFIVVDGEKQVTLSARIESIQVEDGSGQSWNLVVHADPKDLSALSLSLPPVVSTVRLSAYYSSQRRKGVIKL